MKRREYAASLGLAIAGARGRLSREALDAIEKARAGGMTFDDDGGAPRTPSKPREKAERPQRAQKPKTAKDGGDVFLTNETRYPMDSIWRGTDSKGKTHKVNGRTVCVTCGYSLCGHTCNTPIALLPNLERAPVVMT